METSADFLSYVAEFNRMIAEIDQCEMDDDEFIALSFERNHWESCYEQALEEEKEIAFLQQLADMIIQGT